jgi:antitoxin FitA
VLPHVTYTPSMSKMIQIRDVPDEVHSILKARAARDGMSLSDYLKRELERTAHQPNLREWVEMVRHMKPISSGQSSSEIVRELRDQR